MRPLCQSEIASSFVFVLAGSRTDARAVRPYNRYTSHEEIGKLQGGNGISPRRTEIKVRKNEMKVRKNEMKLRKNEIEVPKNFCLRGESRFLPWRLLTFARVSRGQF